MTRNETKRSRAAGRAWRSMCVAALTVTLATTLLTASPPVAAGAPQAAVPPAAELVDVEDLPGLEGLTPEQRERLDAVRSALAGQDAAKVSLDAASQAANLAMTELAAATRRAEDARDKAAEAQVELMLAKAEQARARVDVQRFARQLVLDGGDPGVTAVVDLLLDDSADPWESLRAAAALSRVGDSLAAALNDLATARDKAVAATGAAHDAAEVAARQEQTARDRQVEAAALVAAAQVRLANANDAVAEVTGDLALADVAAGPGDGSACAPPAAVSGFANGQIPAQFLCPVPSVSGHLLRTDAAVAFGRLSAAYAKTFGSPVCVTDSYRSYEAQVSVRARKPTLAAVPGTSNHGWGRAVDLCGGIESFGTPQHEWMRRTAPLFGWFHPAWAGQDGSKPEAWHWEFSAELAAQIDGLLTPARPAVAGPAAGTLPAP